MTSLRRICFQLRNKALAGAFEVSSYAKGKEETQFSNKIKKIYPQRVECVQQMLEEWKENKLIWLIYLSV
jgi:hypothetical protein